MTDFPSLIVFGSLDASPPIGDLHQFLRNEHLGSVRKSFSTLPELWDTLSANDSTLELLHGRTAATQMAAWATNGTSICESTTHRNAINLPLTVLHHLCGYLNYVQQVGPHSAILERAAAAGGIQGFCVGLLSALVIAGSREEDDVGVYGSLAVRLAFAIGAYIDLDCLQNGSSSCLAVRWKSSTGLDTVRRMLEKYESSYISAQWDTKNATITMPSSSILAVSKDLTAEGIIVSDTGLKGRYHTQDHQGIPEKVIASCRQQQHAPVCFGRQQVVRSNTDGKVFPHEDAVLNAVKDILMRYSNWHPVISEAASRLCELAESPFILSIGSDAVPPSVSKTIKVLRALTLSLPKLQADARKEEPQEKYPENAVAIVGMSCKFPGADSIDEFWQLLMRGDCMVEHVPPNRWPETFSTRGSSAKKKFWGNFVSEIDIFDHRFFKKSSREAATMDPQQRLLLQCAYHALESSGYFSSSPRSHDVGCYLGLCATDYNANVACYAPNAFSSLGTLRAFQTGKISHHFGWTGPSITFDTACSASAVAIHSACRALQADECSMALAGGVALFTSPYVYENLSAAHFLSPTGATKPFDAKADGYCRGEGVGMVVLKKLSVAIADGDDILAVIGGSAINQNSNIMPITVPHSSSQGELYRKVAQQSGILPHQVSFVESHGTGTAVGDPIEMESIRAVFGGHHRRSELVVSSVKGNIGHLEGASGVASLIKAVLQIENRMATKQASFQVLNPRIPPLAPDRIAIPMSNLPLRDRFITACVNNYGASGSNSAMMIMQPPRGRGEPFRLEVSSPSKYPILISANSPISLMEYCRALRDYCQRRTDEKDSLGSIAFHLAKQQNQDLPYALVTKASSTLELEAQLTRQLSDSTSSVVKRPSRQPLVLTFGGQVRDYVGLSKELWQQSAIFRSHLNCCDGILRSMDHPSFYPAIFQTEPIEDVVTLHTALFASQYAAAKAWIDCGLQVSTLVGHSFGQLTALTISGILSLEDGLKLVAGRASLMKAHCESGAGAMIAVEADYGILSGLSHSLETACYNGPSSHVLVGDKLAVDEFQGELSRKGLRFKKLAVTYGYHSKFMDPIVMPLKELASSLQYNKPMIPIETCTQGSSWLNPTAELLAAHTRNPVFFEYAIQRLAKRLGPCTWLEAGSDSSITGMVRCALGSSNLTQHTFQPMSLSKPTALDSIAVVTTDLWTRGHNVQFWNFHSLQRSQYDRLRLPLYQFEKHSHWLELIPPPSAAATALPTAESDQAPELIKLVKQDAEGALFKIDARSEEYRRLVNGHAVAGSPLCPGTLYMEMAARACKIIISTQSSAAHLLEFSNFRIDSPLGLASNLDLTLTLRRLGELSWEFSIANQARDGTRRAAAPYAMGNIKLQTDVERIDREFSRYERLTGQDDIEALYLDPDSESIRGAMLYRMFSRVVEYGEEFRGLKSVAAKRGKIAGTVVSMPRSADDVSITMPPTVDSFMQVAGMHANSIHPCPQNEVYVFTKFDQLQFGSGFQLGSAGKGSQSWDIFANMTSIGKKDLVNDIYVFDSISKRLVVIMFGVRFNNVRLSSLTKVLSKTNGDASNATTRAAEPECPIPAHKAKKHVKVAPPELTPILTEYATTACHDLILSEVCLVFEKVVDIPQAKIRGDLLLKDLGIDSLMMLEVVGELSNQFAIDIRIEDMEDLTSVDLLVSYLQKRGCGSDARSPTSTDTPSTIHSTYTPIESSSLVSSVATLSSNHGACPQMGPRVDQITKLLQEHLELTHAPNLNDNLADLGLDSLLAIELSSDLERMFSVIVDLHQINETSTVQDLLHLVGQGTDSMVDIVNPSTLHRWSKQEGGYAANSKALQNIHGIHSVQNTQQVWSLRRLEKQSGIPLETIVWKTIDGLDLCADIYYPPDEEDSRVQKKRPVALLIHGGGHVLFTRKDINMKHIKILLDRGFLPVSVDYRLCPEVNLIEGPMTDVCDALSWARSTLPYLALARPDVQIDAGRLVAVGWSSGGHLAMTLAYTAKSRAIRPPDAVLAFYCPSNFEDEFWQRPIYPKHVKESPGVEYDVLEGVQDKPIAGYTPSTAPTSPMTLSDPRWRIVIHYNWKAQLLPILINGLPSRANAAISSSDLNRLPRPTTETIQAISPFAQVVAGRYRTPTFIVHGTRDDLIPYKQSQDTMEALRTAGVEAGFVAPEGAGHAFDLWSGEDPMGTGWEAIHRGYEFLCRHAF